jgi:hypothetical protein
VHVSTLRSRPTVGSNDRRIARGLLAHPLGAVLLGGLVRLYAFVAVMDPFSTGRFTLIKGVDIAISARAWSHAGRVRDARFDGAVFGNSRTARFAPNIACRMRPDRGDRCPHPVGSR